LDGQPIIVMSVPLASLDSIGSRIVTNSVNLTLENAKLMIQPMIVVPLVSQISICMRLLLLIKNVRNTLSETVTISCQGKINVLIVMEDTTKTPLHLNVMPIL
jgi:hypothetical protein